MKNKIISIGILLVIAAAVGFKAYQHKNPEAFKDLLPAVDSTTVAATAVTQQDQLQIVTSTPINGTLKGVIEVGASGFNSFVVNIDKDKNWELVSKEFGESLAYEGFATVQDVQTGLKKYLSKMFSKGVAGRNAHFVMSSGALKNPKTKLIADAIEGMGYVVNRVTADQEGKYALRALLPKAYVDNSFTVDIGSGNTKISWYEGNKLRTIEAAGAKFYQGPKSSQAVYDEIAGSVKQIPSGQRKYVFLIGGVPFQLAKQVKQGDNRYTSLEEPDFYSAGDDVKLKSGLTIYRAIHDTAKAEGYIFDWDANFTIGFLMTIN